MWYLTLATPPLNRSSLHVVCRSLLAQISPPALISAVSAICCSYLPLSFSEQWEKKGGERRRKTAASFRFSCPTPSWCLANPLTHLSLGLPQNSLQQLSSSDQRKGKTTCWAGRGGKSTWLWNRKQWEVSGEHNGGFVMEGLWLHGEIMVTLVPGLDVNHRATEMTAGLFVWGVNF